MPRIRTPRSTLSRSTLQERLESAEARSDSLAKSLRVAEGRNAELAAAVEKAGLGSAIKQTFRFLDDAPRGIDLARVQSILADEETARQNTIAAAEADAQSAATHETLALVIEALGLEDYRYRIGGFTGFTIPVEPTAFPKPAPRHYDTDRLLADLTTARDVAREKATAADRQATADRVAGLVNSLSDAVTDSSKIIHAFIREGALRTEADRREKAAPAKPKPAPAPKTPTPAKKRAPKTSAKSTVILRGED